MALNELYYNLSVFVYPACPPYFWRACPVKFFAEDERSEFHRGSSGRWYWGDFVAELLHFVQQDPQDERIGPTPLYHVLIFLLDELSHKGLYRYPYFTHVTSPCLLTGLAHKTLGQRVAGSRS